MAGLPTVQRTWSKEKMELVESCNLCGSPERTQFYSLRDWLMGRDDVTTEMVKCTCCGLVYQSPRPTSVELEKHYGSVYEPYQVSRNFRNSSFIQRMLINSGLNSKAKMATQTKDTGKLLDIGCSDGMFLNYLHKKTNWIGEGVEINPQVAKQAQDEFGLRIFVGQLEEARFDNLSFDVVTMWDVLEHLPDPAGTLREINRILKNGGKLAIRLPNIESRDSSLFGKYWAGYDSPRHFFVFGINTIREILERNGYKVVAINTTTGAYNGFIISLKFLLTAKGIGKNWTKMIMAFLINPVMRVLMFPIFYIRSMNGKGTQMSVLAIKNENYG